jgi:hypothetical protein
LITASVVKLLMPFGVDPLYAARMSSVLLWALGCALLSALLRWLGARKTVAIGAGILGASIPVAFLMGSFVTPHAAQLVISVGFCWLALAHIRTERPSRGLIATSLLVVTLAMLTVPHALFGVLILAVAIILGRGPKSSRSSSLVIGLGVLVAAGLCHFAWSRLANARVTDFSERVELSGVSQIPDSESDSVVAHIVGNWWTFWPNALYGDSGAYGPGEHFMATAIVYLAWAGLGTIILSKSSPMYERALAISLLIISPVTAVLADAYFTFPVPARYGSSAVGIGLAVIALSVKNGYAQIIFLLGALASYAASFLIAWP